MRYLACPAWGTAAALTWHLLGAAWAFGALAAALAFVALTLPAAMTAASTAGEKARALERRLNTLIPSIPDPQASPGQASNTSYGMAGGTMVTSNQQSSSNNGGIDSNTSGRTNAGDCGAADNGGHTSGQIGGAAAHYHDMSHSHPGDQHDHTMTHYHVSNADLQAIFNALRDNHGTLMTTHNTLISRLETSGILT